eukprot:1141859-Pelagomonas_calceolata.AAC.3
MVTVLIDQQSCGMCSAEVQQLCKYAEALVSCRPKKGLVSSSSLLRRCRLWTSVDHSKVVWNIRKVKAVHLADKQSVHGKHTWQTPREHTRECPWHTESNVSAEPSMSIFYGSRLNTQEGELVHSADTS